MASKTFAHRFYFFNSGLYYIVEADYGATTVTETDDGGSDSLTQLGDSGNDDFQIRDGGGQPSNGSYLGRTDNGFVGRSELGGYYLYTDNNYQFLTRIASFRRSDVNDPNTRFLVCYAEGTAIRVLRAGFAADVPIEALRIGDLAVTASGAHRPIRWIGHRTIDPRRHAEPHKAMPVRVAAHAFGPDRPARDLRVSPGHAICVDLLGEVLIPADALVNGSTIVQEEVESVTYWHIELDSHDILIAEGLPAESYLDMGNRGFFAESGLVDLDAEPDADPASRTHADFCRPFHAAGAPVEFVRERLRARAAGLGWRLEEETWAGAHLLVDGRRVAPDTRGLTARFVVPAGAREVWLVSGTSVPRHVGLNGDGRRLGLGLAGLRIDDGWSAPRAVALDDPLLCAGFHAAEEAKGRLRRWTAGRARLPSALWADCEGAFLLWVDLVRPALPRWVAPEAAAQRLPAAAPAAGREALAAAA